MELFKGILAVFMLIFLLIAMLLPDDSLFKQIFAYVSTAAILIAFVWMTPFGNPIKWLLRKMGILK